MTPLEARISSVGPVASTTSPACGRDEGGGRRRRKSLKGGSSNASGLWEGGWERVCAE